MGTRLALILAFAALNPLCTSGAPAAEPRPATAPARSLDSPSAGRALLSNLNCTACHGVSDAQAKWLAPKGAPRLADIGARASGEWIERFLASPHDALPGTTMP